jgi:transposase
MEQKPKKHYTKEFQIQALNLVKEYCSFTKVANQLGIRDSLIHAWKKKYIFEINSKAKDAASSVAEIEEIKRLRKENEELIKVNYILKRAAAFFSPSKYLAINFNFSSILLHSFQPIGFPP